MPDKKPSECVHKNINRDYEHHNPDEPTYIARCIDCGVAISVLPHPNEYSSILEKLEEIKREINQLRNRT